MPTAMRSNASRTTPRYSPARLSDHQSLAFAVEKLQSKLLLQGLHLVADGALRHAQLFRGARKALVTRCGFEGFERVQRWKTTGHAAGTMRKTRPV